MSEPTDGASRSAQTLKIASSAPSSSAPSILADRIRDAIMDAAPSFGTKLFTIGELVQQTGHGAGVVREALSLLSSEGLIEVRQGKQGGVFAKRPDTDVLKQPLRSLIRRHQMTDGTVIEARQQLEGACARLAAHRRDPRDVQRLSESVAAMSGLTDAPEAFAIEAMKFHTLLCEASGNRLLAHMNWALRELFHQPTASVPYCADDLRAAVRAHQRITDAVASGDEDGAYRAVMLHIEAFATLAGAEDIEGTSADEGVRTS